MLAWISVKQALFWERMTEAHTKPLPKDVVIRSLNNLTASPPGHVNYLPLKYYNIWRKNLNCHWKVMSEAAAWWTWPPQTKACGSEADGLWQITPVMKCSAKYKSVFLVFMIGDSVAVCQRLPLQAVSPLGLRALPQPAATAPLKVNIHLHPPG